MYQEEIVIIQGIKQYLLHFEGESHQHVILYVHGGPGFSEANFGYLMSDAMQQRYPIVFWDQRGAGRTALINKKKHLPTTVEEMIRDLYEVVEAIKKRYQVKQVILIGHSWGSILCSLYVLRYPECIEAYIGTGQFVSTLENERIGVRMLMNVASKKDVRRLEKLLPYPVTDLDELSIKMRQVRKIQSKYEQQSLYALYKIMSKSPTFKLTDFIPLFALNKNNQALIKDMLVFDLNNESNQYQCPVHYILGEEDTMTPSSIAIDYLNNIEAPSKSFSLINGAKHTPFVEQPKQSMTILLTIINQLKNKKEDDITLSS